MKSFGVVLSALIVGSTVMAGCSSTDDAAENGSNEEDLKASSCKGFLPKNCAVCDDGTTACAHFAVKNKKCVIETCPEPAPITSPSQCKGLLPQSCKVCDDGTSACAHWGVKDGKCEIETCPTAPAPECTVSTVAADCKGPLPQIMVQCKDGTTAGAHHVCVKGKCGVETCPE